MTATMRGPYMNTGSKDVGPDLDYDIKTGTWHGRPTIDFENCGLFREG